MSQDTTAADTRICDNCRYENQFFAVRCLKCGSLLLVPDTLPISPDEIPNDTLVDMKYGMKTIQHDRYYDGALFLYVVEHAQSVILVDKQDIVLGREGQSSKSKPGDLSRFSAYAMGVSRQHAQITYEDGQYILKDLGSANGTWVNGHRLPAYERYLLKNEDHIWLGKLILKVYLAP